MLTGTAEESDSRGERIRSRHKEGEFNLTNLRQVLNKRSGSAEERRLKRDRK